MRPKLLAVIWLMFLFGAGDEAQTLGPRPLITQAIDENQRVKLTGNTRPEARRENDLGSVTDDLHLDMYLQLKRSPEMERAAAQFVESLTDKSSPNFHKWITAAEYGERFGVPNEDIATVSRWLESHGFKVNGVPTNRMVIDFSGTAGQVREAFHTEIHHLAVTGGSCKIRPQAAEAGENACPTNASAGLAVVARAVSPAEVEFCNFLLRYRRLDRTVLRRPDQ